ncbi:hypothetical protein QCA50_009108 [Cerrena zonata]|uniref:Uncharacterized protein n=1 Tax=Cerrena zonata TaxID=2478898 RepID=A0AAW0G970_9APHY
MSKRACVGNMKNSSAKARTKVKRDEQAVTMWKERGARLILIMASQLIEMKDYTAAIHLLNPLASSSQPVPQLQATILRIRFRVFEKVESDIRESAEGKWDEVEWIWKEYISAEKIQGVDVEKSYYVAINNLSVTLLSQGKLRESTPTVVTAEPILFNLSTLYELRSNTVADKKRGLLVEVARFAGNGLRTSCLKMPVSGS